jgi:hypothetical protein
VPRGRSFSGASPRKIVFAEDRIGDNMYEDAGSVAMPLS